MQQGTAAPLELLSVCAETSARANRALSLAMRCGYLSTQDAVVALAKGHAASRSLGAAEHTAATDDIVRCSALMDDFAAFVNGLSERGGGVGDSANSE